MTEHSSDPTATPGTEGGQRHQQREGGTRSDGTTDVDSTFNNLCDAPPDGPAGALAVMAVVMAVIDDDGVATLRAIRSAMESLGSVGLVVQLVLLLNRIGEQRHPCRWRETVAMMMHEIELEQP
ncbi:MAG: hypothetical protein WKF57_10250 [Nakamurella sp.]